MNEQQTAAIFAEFLRLGLDPETARMPLVVTGFTRRRLLEWLRGQRSGIGADELERRLASHARDAVARAEAAGESMESDPERFDPSPNPGVVRWWPTTIVLDRAIQVMAEEWDPIGMRIGSVPPEDLGEYTLRLLWPLMHRWPYGTALEMTVTSLAALEGSLGLRKSPPLHLRYLAARLREVVAQCPLPVREAGQPGVAISVAMSDAMPVPPPRDPEGVCSRCKSFGTVARVTTKSDPPRTVRYCGACWREVRSRYMPTADGSLEREAIEANKPAAEAESRSWADVVEFVRLVLIARQEPERGAEITDELLAQLAVEIATDADIMDGPMPDEIEEFVREYAPSR